MGDEARDEELAVVNLEHVKRISDTFRPNTVKKNGSIQKTVVQEIWKNRLAPRFYSAMMSVMFPGDAKEVSFLSFYTIYKNLAEPEAEIVFRALTIYHIATIHEPPFNYEQAEEYPNAPLMNIKAYVCDVITSYLHSIIHINMKEPLGWLELKASNSITEGNLVAAYLLKDLESHRNEVNIGSLEVWLEKSEIYYTVSVELYLYLFGVNKTIDVKSLVPFPIVQTGKNSRTLMSLPDVLLLNSKLPKRAPRWTLAFMLDSRTGDWEKFKQAIYGKGQTLIVIQDSNGDIFGMYGSQQWVPSSGFYGNDQSFLFTLKPDVNVYESSGRNKNFQIFTDTGIGMGGSEDNFGLFINYGAETGLTSLSCSTFRQFWPLARELDFTIVQIEIWIVSEDPIAAPVEVVEIGKHGEKEKNVNLLSKDLEVAKLTNDLIKNDLLNKSESKMIIKQGSGMALPNKRRTPGNKDDKLEKIVEAKSSETTSVIQEALQQRIGRGEDGLLTVVGTPGPSGHNNGDNLKGKISHVHSCKRMPSEIKLSKMEITTGNKDDKEYRSRDDKGIVQEITSEATLVVQEALQKQSERVEDGLLTIVGTPGPSEENIGNNLIGKMSHVHSRRRMSLERKLSKMEMTLGNKEDKVMDEIVEETRSDATSFVQEALQKQSERDEAGLLTKVTTPGLTGQNNEDDSTGKMSQDLRCVRKSNKDLLRPLIDDLSNFNAQQGELVRLDGYVHPSEGENLGRSPKTRKPYHVSAEDHDNFIHPSLKPKQDETFFGIPKEASNSPQPKASNNKPKQGTASLNINNSSADEKSDGISYNTTKHPVYNRLRNYLVDVQVQVGESKILPLKCRASRKNCACNVKSTCYCENTEPLLKTKMLRVQPVGAQMNPLLYVASSSTTPTSCRFKSHISLKNKNLDEIQHPIRPVYESCTRSKPNISDIVSVETTQLKNSEHGSNMKITNVKEQIPPVTNASQTGISQVKIDLRPCKDDPKSDSMSMIGCRCSSSTESNSDWEGDGRTSERKLKSECCCQDKTTLLDDLDGANKYTCDDESMMSKLKDVSSSMCSCVLGPKDQGVRTASEKQSTLKDTQQLTRSSMKSNMSLGSGGLSTKPNNPSDAKYGFLRSSDKESQCRTKSFRSSEFPLKSGDNPSSRVTNSALLSCNERHTRPLRKSFSFEESKVSTAMPPIFRDSKIKYSALPCSSDENELRKSLKAGESLSSSITDESLLSCNTRFAKHMTNEFQPPTINKTLCHSKKSSKTIDPSVESSASARFCAPAPPTCLSCRSLVKLNGCQCKSRLKTKLNPIIEQEELLQQQRISVELTSKSSELTLKNVRRTGPSAIALKTQDSSTFKTNINEDSSKKSYESSTTISKSKDASYSVKKSCQCSLPRSCFPQFPEDQIQTDDDVKKCGCGTHGADTAIRFPTFPEITEENSQTANTNSISEEDLTASRGASGTDDPKKRKRSQGTGKGMGQGTCPCEDEDGTIIILNVSKCNTMQALEKIVQELDVKFHPDLPSRLTMPESGSAKPKSCEAPVESETERIKLLLKSKMKGAPKDLSETKIPRPRE